MLCNIIHLTPSQYASAFRGEPQIHSATLERIDLSCNKMIFRRNGYDSTLYSW